MARLTMFWHLRWWSSFLAETGSAGRDVIMEFDDQGRESAARISLQNVIWSVGAGVVERGRQDGPLWSPAPRWWGRFACKCDYLMADGHTWGLQVACFHQAVWNHPSSFQKEPVEDDFTSERSFLTLLFNCKQAVSPKCGHEPFNWDLQ